MSDYGVKDIKTLEGIKAIRLRPGMYIGSTEQAGVRHITLELISNAVDEYLNGHCTECTVEVGDLEKGEFIVKWGNKQIIIDIDFQKKKMSF